MKSKLSPTAQYSVDVVNMNTTLRAAVIMQHLETAGLVIEQVVEVVEREPCVPEVEYQRWRAYVFARKSK